MTITVFSDSHRRSGLMIDRLLVSLPDMVIFLGDITDDILDLNAVFPDLPIIAVAGNCDYERGDIKEVTLKGKRFLLCHGHQFGVKTGLERLCAEGKRRKADAVLFGHTHKQYAETRDGILYLNPGAVSSSDGFYFAEITIIEKELTYALFRQ